MLVFTPQLGGLIIGLIKDYLDFGFKFQKS